MGTAKDLFRIAAAATVLSTGLLGMASVGFSNPNPLLSRYESKGYGVVERKNTVTLIGDMHHFQYDKRTGEGYRQADVFSVRGPAPRRDLTFTEVRTIETILAEND